MDWRPIDTAPKDGTNIDLWVVNQDGEGWRIADAYWVHDRERDPYAPSKGKRDGWFAPDREYGDPGWADWPEGWTATHDGREYFDRATHWMPLPEPPK